MHWKIAPLFALCLLLVGAQLPDAEEAQKKFMQATQPGPEHKVLEGLVGTWVVSQKIWQRANTPSLAGSGMAKNRWILGGRYLETEFEGSVMGRPYEGRALLGYDTIAGAYSGTWISTNQTEIQYTEGTYDPETKSITSLGKMGNPLTGKKMDIKTVIRMESKDRVVYEVFGPGPDGATFQMLEAVYTRK